ncbi:MAG TPA: TadE/TadG family type IV pilus assembly protein [Rhodopila sp.]
MAKVFSMPGPFRRSGRIGAFLRDESGTVLVEFVLYLPLLLWAWIGLYAYWEAYSEINVAQKASFSIADMISREQTAVTDSYRNGLRDVFAYMTQSKSSDVTVRYTSITWSAAKNRYEVHWSYSTNTATMPKLTTSAIVADNRIPIMADGDYLLIVETTVRYRPSIRVPFYSNLKYSSSAYSPKTSEIKNFVVTRPRFMRVCEYGQTCSS